MEFFSGSEAKQVKIPGDASVIRSLKLKAEYSRLARTPSPPEEEPYHALWQAVIMQALIDSVSGSQKAEIRRAKLDAATWFNNDNEDFVEVCLLAGFSPERTSAGAKYAQRRARKVKSLQAAASARARLRVFKADKAAAACEVVKDDASGVKTYGVRTETSARRS